MSEDAHEIGEAVMEKDLKQRQAEFKAAIRKSFYARDSIQLENEIRVFNRGFDAFRSSPEYLAMKEALEFYANSDNWDCIEFSDSEDSQKGIPFAYGGKKAREVLSQIEESEGK